jgi:hypothetical protein
VLSQLSRDYLAFSSSSATVEQCFSAAADICGRDRGRLAARTIERCVSSHQWLLQGIKPDGPFQAAQKIIDHAHSKIESKKKVVRVPPPAVIEISS